MLDGLPFPTASGQFIDLSQSDRLVALQDISAMFTCALLSLIVASGLLYLFLHNWLSLGKRAETAPPICTAALHGVSHLGVIMDGNRRYGKKCSGGCEGVPEEQQREISEVVNLTLFEKQYNKCQYFLQLIQGSVLSGHQAGGEKLIDFIVHAKQFGIRMLTVYAFSTDNWTRPKYEVDALMMLFFIYFERMRKVCSQEGIFIRFISTDPQRLPKTVYDLMESIEEESRLIQPRHIAVNVCVSYSGQQEIANAANRAAKEGMGEPITPESLERQLLRSITQDGHESEDAGIFRSSGPSRAPDLIIRTSGEQRISNFLLYESAYSEFFFIQKTWPELSKADLRDVLDQFGHRERRLGK